MGFGVWGLGERIHKSAPSGRVLELFLAVHSYFAAPLPSSSLVSLFGGFGRIYFFLRSHLAPPLPPDLSFDSFRSQAVFTRRTPPTIWGSDELGLSVRKTTGSRGPALIGHNLEQVRHLRGAVSGMQRTGIPAPPSPPSSTSLGALWTIHMYGLCTALHGTLRAQASGDSRVHGREGGTLAKSPPFQ